MTWPEIYLLCFAVGALWSVATLLLGGMHLGHGHIGHTHFGGAHSHGPLDGILNPSSIAVFLAWFGGVGFLLNRHSGLGFWIDLSIAVAIGLIGAWILALFLRFLSSREQPLDPADYEMIGVLGHVSSPIRPGGVGEVIYQRDGARKPLCAKSEEDILIARGEEVIVTRYEKGIAYVRTWEAMTQPPTTEPQP
jgi:membrane protein implicated in regulation of membrane protease activity